MKSNDPTVEKERTIRLPDINEFRPIKILEKALAHHDLQRIRSALPGALVVLNLLALTGFVVRDRNLMLALMLYLPLIPIGLAALSLDLLQRGRALKRVRFLLAFVGLASITCSCLTMIGRGSENSPSSSAESSEIRLLHWNVLWGGRPYTETGWTSIEEAIIQRRPDIIVLNEALPSARLDSLQERLGKSWSSIRVQQDRESLNWYKMVVMSRWPVQEGQMVTIRHGSAVDVRVVPPGRSLRLLVVDGESKISQSRTPMLMDLSNACQREADSGNPFDIVLGDFNAVGRSLGFDRFQAVGDGYILASRSCRGWRGTWPMPMPIFDIDHVWLRAGCRLLSCSIFADLRSDHRGQLVRLAIAKPNPLEKSK